MGMHFGLAAVRGSISDFKATFPKVWPTFEITSSNDNFPSAEAVWSWMKEHQHFVSAAGWTKENPGTQCAFLTQHGPWVIFMDPSYVLASDENALKQLSVKYGAVISFVIESAGGCAYFWCYESGLLRRSIINSGEEVQTEGNPLPEENGLDINEYYMQETEALMHAFGLPPVEGLPIAAATIAIALTDRTDYSELMKKRASAQTESLSTNKRSIMVSTEKTTGNKPWWKFW